MWFCEFETWIPLKPVLGALIVLQLLILTVIEQSQSNRDSSFHSTIALFASWGSYHQNLFYQTGMETTVKKIARNELVSDGIKFGLVLHLSFAWDIFRTVNDEWNKPICVFNQHKILCLRYFRIIQYEKGFESNTAKESINVFRITYM